MAVGGLLIEVDKGCLGFLKMDMLKIKMNLKSKRRIFEPFSVLEGTEV